MDRVELIIQLTGDTKAMSSLREMQRLANDLGTKKVQLKMDAAEIDRQLADKKRKLQELTARRHDIKLDMDNRAKAVESDIKKIDQQIKELTSRKKEIHIQLDGARELTDQMLQWQKLAHDLERELHNLDPGDKEGFKKLTADIRAARDEYNRLADQKKRIEFDHKDLREVERQLVELGRKREALVAKRDGIKMDTAALDKVDRQIDELQREINDLTKQRKEIGIDAKLNSEALSLANTELRDMEKNAFTVADAIKGIGSAFSTVGSLASSVGSIFGQMASLAGGNVMNTVVRTLTGYGTILATQGLGTATSRFDTFRTFPRVMEIMGYSIDEVDVALKRLEASVLGLPTALNDIIDMARDFILLTGDLDRGVELATSINNLFVAGGADAEEVRIGLKQFRDLLSKGSLMDREWDSLARTLGVALRFIASEAGYAEESFGDFRTALKKGEIGVDEFLDAVVRAGSSGRVKSVLEEMKDTLNATLTNLRTAFANLGATVLTEFDKLFTAREGKGLPGMILELSTAVKQQLIPAVRDWTALNADRIFAIFDWLRSFDWGALLRGIADNILYVVEKLLAFADAVGHENIVWFFSHGTQWSMMSKQFSTLGGALSSLGGVITTIGNALGNLTTILAGFNWLTGGAVTKAFAEMSVAIGGLGGAAAAAIPALIGIGSAVGVAVMALTQWDSAAKRRESITRDKFGFDNIDSELTSMERALSRHDELMSTYDASMGVVEQRLAKGKQLVQEIIALSTKANTTGEIELMASKVAELQRLFPDISVELDEVTGRMTKNGRAALDAADGVMEYAAALEKADIAALALEKLEADKLQLEIELAVNEASLKNLYKILDELLANPVEKKDYYGADNSAYWQYVNDVEAAKQKIAEAEAAQSGLKSAIDETSGAYNTLAVEQQNAAAVVESVSKARQDAIKQEEEIAEELKELYKDLHEKAHEYYDELARGFDKLDKITKQKLSEMEKADRHNAEILKGHNEDLKTILKDLEENSESMSDAQIRMYADVAFQGVEGGGYLAAIADAIRNDKEGLAKLTAAYEAEFLAASEAADLTTQIEYLATKFLQGYQEVMADSSWFGDEGFKLLNENDLKNVAEEATAIGETLQEGINEVFGEGGDAAQGITLFSEDTIKAMLTPMKEALTNEDTGLVASFNTLRDAMSTLTKETIPETKEAFDDLKKAIDDLKKSVDELTEAIEDLIKAMKEANDITNKWRGAIIRLKDTINEAVPVVQSLATEVNVFTTKVTGAIDELGRLVTAISNLGGLSIDIPVNAGGSFNSGEHGGRSGPQEYAKGGPVYLARGGTFWIPRGTDTVPAMLTPGEFVLRRPAVQKLGVPFLNMLNRLDIPRAIDALMSRVVLPSAMSSVVYDNRRSYDNHATVNQNIYTNNPDYAYRRASRWAHAL